MNDFLEVSIDFDQKALVKISAIRYVSQRRSGGCYISLYGNDKDNCLPVSSSYEEIQRAIRKAKEE